MAVTACGTTSVLLRLWGAYAIAPEDQDDDPGSGSLEAAEPLLPGTAAQRALPLPAEGWRCLLLPAYRRVVLLAIALPLLQQASGINTVIYFSSEVRRHCWLGCMHPLSHVQAQRWVFTVQR